MDLFHRHSDENDNLDHFEAPEALESATPAEDAPEVVTDPTPVIDPSQTSNEDYDYEARDWRRISLQVLAGLVILLIIVFGGRWLHHELSHKSTVKPAPANTKQLPAAPNGANSGANSSATASVSSTSPAQSSTTLPNTGPGDDLAIFLVVAFAAASLHYANGLRKS